MLFGIPPQPWWEPKQGASTARARKVSLIRIDHGWWGAQAHPTLRLLIIHGTAESVAEQILSFREEVGDFGTLLYAGRAQADISIPSFVV